MILTPIASSVDNRLAKQTVAWRTTNRVALQHPWKLGIMVCSLADRVPPTLRMKRSLLVVRGGADAVQSMREAAERHSILAPGSLTEKVTDIAFYRRIDSIESAPRQGSENGRCRGDLQEYLQ